MSNAILSRSLRVSKTSSISPPLFYPALCTSRAASLNSAIHHGIRRSRGVGFRGKEQPRIPGAGLNYGGRDKTTAFSKGPTRISEYQKVTNHRSDRKVRTPGSRNAPYQGRDFDEGGFGKKGFGNGTALGEDGKIGRSFGRGIVTAFGRSSEQRSLGRPATQPSRESYRSAFPRRKSNNHDQLLSGDLGPSQTLHNNHQSSEPQPTEREQYPSLSRKKPTYSSTSRASYDKERDDVSRAYSAQNKSRKRDFRPDDNGNASRQYDSRERSFNPKDRGPRFDVMETNRERDTSSQSRIDTRIPVSIPYTTPASEFLYGTSVVEAALTSRKVPRRKHYKLYIYNGDNREGTTVQRDAGLERLAKKNGVDVVRVSGDWLRIMDKMSGGRPHNGYILEASPLPRQPIISLGEMITKDGHTGFQVNLDHQSREEAAVNGIDEFIKYSSNVPGRKPLVLLLDSIVDPGNLGGIIRTASFLGVTAIAVSTRNSASFTSVVLKASAGASENVTIFSVNKPAGFLVDSKAAGWKVYAAVAPSGRQDPDVPETLTTDQLDDPLSENPCILMLGGEGEGLRWNLRSKADVDLSIRGSGRSHNVDSLNVSVAAGILCSSFLSRSKMSGISEPIEEGMKEGEQTEPPSGDLF